LVPLLLYILIEAISTALQYRYSNSVFDIFNGRIIELVILMLLISRHIALDYRLAPIVSWVYVFGVFCLSILFVAGIGIDIDITYRSGRLLIFGENPNMIGIKSVIALLIILSHTFRMKPTRNRYAFYLLMCLAISSIFSLLMATASRGALLSMFVGIFLFILFWKNAVKAKVFLILSLLAASYLVYNVIIRDDEKFKSRVLAVIEEGEIGRNDIWKASINIIDDNFLFGVGRMSALPVMQKYSGKAMDPHNVFLYVFLTAGLAGFLFFFFFVFRIGYYVYEDFRKNGNPMYFVIFIILILNMSKAGGFMNKTFLWFILAFLIGSVLNEEQSKMQTTSAFK
jgi:O-antigen ligase